MRSLTFSALTIVALLTIGARADEPPYLEFVRGLRAHGMPDLALEYLGRLGRKPPADLAPILPLEIAKTRLELATLEPDAGRRAAAQLQARSEFETFVKKNPKHPLVAEANLEIARIGVLQGKGLLTRARQLDGNPRQRVEFLRARIQFEEAGKQLEAVSAQIDAQLAGSDSASTAQAKTEKNVLTQAKLQAELEKGVNLLLQVQTYVDQSEDAKRSEILKKAIDTLDKAAAQRGSTSDPICWEALAWLGRCQQENDDPKGARKIYAEVIAEPGEQAASARRLARFFRMQTLAKDPDLKNPLLQVQLAGEEWLRLYPQYLNSPEGCGVRFELADAYVKQVASLPKTPQRAQREAELYQKAQKLYEALEQSENDYTSKARENRLIIILKVAQERSRGDITKLKDFEECYLRAQLEVAQINQAAKKLTGENLEGEREKHYKNILKALTLGLDKTNGGAPADHLNDARFLLSYVYLTTGDYYRAAVWGEELARTAVKSVQAPMAAAYALRSYALLVAKQEQAGAAKDDLAADRERLRKLAVFVEQTWPNDPAADLARHMLALVLLGEKNYAQAIEVLERVTSTYSELSRCLYELAGAALQAEREEFKPPPGRPSYQVQAEKALLRIPDLAGTSDPATVRDYFGAKLTLANIYYRTKRYEALQALAQDLLKRLGTLDEKTKAAHQANVLALKLYADLGRAEAEYTGGRYAKARQILDPVVTQMKNLAQAGLLTEVKEKDPRLIRALLGLALRASVQDNKLDAGREILDLLQKAFPENSLDSLVQLVQQLRDQIQHLRQQGESAKAQLDKTVANFSTFLDELTKQQEKNPRPQVLLFLTQSYSSLDKHTRAAELANRIAEPKTPEGKKEPDPREVQIYRVARILYARELRLDKEFQKADLILKEIQSAPWGMRNVEVKKEAIFLLEDQDKYAGKDGAVLAWSNLMTQMRPRIVDNKVKEQYYECYYFLTYAIFKNALLIADPAKKNSYIRTAATFIIKLQEQPNASDLVKKRFDELLAKERLLKEQYDALKNAAQKK
jgi:hypothetical protein